MKLAFVVATKDRPADLRTLLASLVAQTRPIDQIVVVDASKEPVEAVFLEFPGLNTRYLRHSPPSAAGQRNRGVRSVDPNVDLVGFIDDDATLEPNAVEAMMGYWESATDDFGGVSFNIMNPPPVSGKWLKRSLVTERLGLYRSRTGQVAPSGWQTVMETVSETCLVDWLATGAVVWRRDILSKHSFDEYFEGYSYLEDLDFSYTVGKAFKLVVLAEAGYYHWPSSGGRGGSYHFGRIEVANRLYFVRKHKLSLWRCYVGIGVRIFLSLAGFALQARPSFLSRVAGNLVELCSRPFASSIAKKCKTSHCAET